MGTLQCPACGTGRCLRVSDLESCGRSVWGVYSNPTVSLDSVWSESSGGRPAGVLLSGCWQRRAGKWALEPTCVDGALLQEMPTRLPEPHLGPQ